MFELFFAIAAVGILVTLVGVYSLVGVYNNNAPDFAAVGFIVAVIGLVGMVVVVGAGMRDTTTAPTLTPEPACVCQCMKETE